MLNKNVFPSLPRRGGRAIKKNDAEGHQSWRGRGGQSSKRVWNAVRDISSEMTTPSAPIRNGTIFLMAHPPLLFPDHYPQVVRWTRSSETTGGKGEVPSLAKEGWPRPQVNGPVPLE